MLSKSDQKRIADAVAAAEDRTQGEITCVLAQEVSNYREVPLGWAALVALGLPPLLVLAGLQRLALADIFSSWTDDSVRMVEDLIVRALSSYALAAGGALFLAVALVASLPAIRRVLTPGALKRHRVRQVARHHFVAIGYKLGHQVPHILIFASLKDRRVELVAHKAIHEAVGQALWDEAVAAVTRGMKAGRPADGFVTRHHACAAMRWRNTFPPPGRSRTGCRTRSSRPDDNRRVPGAFRTEIMNLATKVPAGFRQTKRPIARGLDVVGRSGAEVVRADAGASINGCWICKRSARSLSLIEFLQLDYGSVGAAGVAHQDCLRPRLRPLLPPLVIPDGGARSDPSVRESSHGGAAGGCGSNGAATAAPHARHKAAP